MSIIFLACLIYSDISITTDKYQGMGVVTNEGIITAHHVVNDSKFILINNKYYTSISEIYDRDLVKLKNVTNLKTYEIGNLNQKLPVQIKNKEYKISHFLILKLENGKFCTCYGVDKKISYGFSGCPVFQHGKVVGIIIRKKNNKAYFVKLQ